MPQRVPRERRITVDDAQEERASLGSGLPVLQQTPEQIIVIVSRERVGVVLHHPAQQRFGSRLIITVQRRAQPRVPLPESLRRRCRTRTIEEERRDANQQRQKRRDAETSRIEDRGSKIEDRLTRHGRDLRSSLLDPRGCFFGEILHQEIGPHFTLLVLRLMKSIITYSPRRKLVVKYALPWAISVIRLTNSTR